MKKLFIVLSLVIIAGIATLSAQNAETKQQKTDVKVYYFHLTHRCATCQAVEAVAKESLNDLYGNKVLFESINIENEEDNPLIKKYKVSGQTLLIIKGDKVVDLTNQAFMNARTNPDKYKAKIKSTIDPII